MMSAAEDQINLDEAALLVAAHADATLSMPKELARLDQMADGAGSDLDGVLKRVFRELGFVGNQTSYYDPANSMLPTVLERRTGIPITLAIVTIEIARRVGVSLLPVGMPGHFLIRSADDPDVFIDPFMSGERLDRDGCEIAFHRLQGADIPFDDQWLEPIGAFDVVGRLLNNLKGIYTASLKRQHLIWVLTLRIAVPGVPLSEHRELAAVLASAGRFLDAATVLDRLSGLDPEHGDEHQWDAEALRAQLN